MLNPKPLNPPTLRIKIKKLKSVGIEKTNGVGFKKANVHILFAAKYPILLLRITLFNFLINMHVIRMFHSSTVHEE